MAHLLNVWPAVSARLLREERALLLFDYDGTLSPIVARPEDALMPPGVRRSLAALVGHPRYIVGIVSGRSLDDLAGRAGIPGIILAGNHGMEIRGPGLEFTHDGAVAARETLGEVKNRLADALAAIPGIIVEDKGLTLTVHYRATPASLTDDVDAIVSEVAKPLVENGDLRLTRGKMVIEVRPNIPWDKGKAIERIRAEFGDSPYPVYFGDDRTDEDGFRMVQAMGGLAVFVGESREGTVALHQLDSPEEVADTLRLLLEEP